MWAEVDDAFTRFCVALCPLDQRERVATPAFRAELSLPQELGWLGIPRVHREACLRAADQWSYRDAAEAGALQANLAAAYHRASAPDASLWEPRGMESYFRAVAGALSDGLPASTTRDLRWRCDRNQLRSALWAFNAVPWVWTTSSGT